MILDDGTTQIVFSDELVWLDEFGWSPIVQSKKYTIGGVLVIQESKKLAGRPITLSGNGEIWETREVVEQLYNASLLKNQDFTLTLHDERAFTVRFDFEQNKPVDTQAVWVGQDSENTDLFIINTLHFIVVA